jgi:hypothetical protein
MICMSVWFLTEEARLAFMKVAGLDLKLMRKMGGRKWSTMYPQEGRDDMLSLKMVQRDA